MGDADDFYYYRKSGQQQIPAFGDWENVNELPITQYFECARQAGLLRCSCSSCVSGHKPYLHPPLKKKTNKIKSCQQHSKDDPRRDNNKSANTHNVVQRSSINVKPVDEDLYKIPSEQLLQNSKRKRMLGFFSRCMVPPCAA